MVFSKSDYFKWSLIFLILFTCITDIITFFTSGLYEFEVNPIILFLKGPIGFPLAITFAVLIKFLLVSICAYYLYSYKPKGTHTWAYLAVYMGIIIVAVQIFGTYANITTTIAYNNAPINEPITPIPIEETVKALNIINIIYYITTFISLLSFYVYEKIYRI